MIFNEKELNNISKLSLDDKIKKIKNSKRGFAVQKKFRSNMMLNPLKLRHLNRIDNLEADMITLNLEDAIAPSRKREALINIALFLSHLKNSNSFIIIRTNPLNEGGAEEIEFLNDFTFDAIRLAKVKEQNDIEKALKILDKSKELHISMETKEAFENLSSLRIDKRFTTANIGILDLLTSLGLPQSLLQRDNPTIHYILSKFLIDSKIAGLHPISFMFQDYKNIDEFRKWCQLEKKMGFTTKACMGPLQVEVANEIFGATPEEIERAKYIKKIFEESVKRGENGFMDERYGFIDEPIYRDALLVLR
ncbi:MAG: CoA ester lyase [Epsilonproteobacteria bacterium]|nr:CoA ester lyase [Campylobacterota bacterium]